MVALEALALGVPVITPRFGPFPFAVQHEVNGLLYEAGNVNALQACLEQVVAGSEIKRQLKPGAAAASASFLLAPTRFSDAVESAFSGGTRGGST